MKKNLIDKFEGIADVELNMPLANMTTLRIGGPAKYVIYPYNEVALEGVMHILDSEALPYKVLGKGSNLLCSDEPFEGAIIRLDRYFTQSYFEENTLVAQAGCSIITLAHDAMRNSLSGLEFASGIPATVGGVIFMNAGAYKSSMSAVTEKVRVYRDGKTEWIPVGDCEFGYRTSVFQKHPDWIVLAASFKLQPGDKEAIRALMDDRRARRMATQPLDKPSAGSVFRNPEEMPAWKLIDSIGFRGKKIGGAQVSEKHGNFIVNAGNASGHDFMELAEEIRRTVKEQYNIDLVMEVEKFNWQ